jgi:hypothetical protein
VKQLFIHVNSFAALQLRVAASNAVRKELI